MKSDNVWRYAVQSARQNTVVYPLSSIFCTKVPSYPTEDILRLSVSHEIGRPRIVRYGTERVGVTEVPVTPPNQADCLVEKKLYLIHSHL